MQNRENLKRITIATLLIAGLTVFVALFLCSHCSPELGPVFAASRNSQRSRVLSAGKKLLGRALFAFCNQFPDTRPFLRQYGMRVTKWLPSGPVTIAFPEGDKLRLTNVNASYLTFQLFWFGGGHYEPITRLVLNELVRRGQTFCDIGANIGFFSLALAKDHPQLKIIAFEPNPKLVKILGANIKANGFRNITCEALALSDTEGDAHLYLSNSDMSASLEKSFDYNQSEPVSIRRTTLDLFLEEQQIPGPLLLKVDVEGHERAFLAGAIRTLSTRKPDMICEVAIHYKAGHPLLPLRNLGYRFYKITDVGLELSEEVSPIIRDQFFFPNYLVSTRSVSEVGRINELIRPEIAKIDLKKSSKYFGDNVFPKAREGI